MRHECETNSDVITLKFFFGREATTLTKLGCHFPPRALSSSRSLSEFWRQVLGQSAYARRAATIHQSQRDASFQNFMPSLDLRILRILLMRLGR